MLSKQAIDEFNTIYASAYGKDLSFTEAQEKALSLLRLYKVILNQPLANGTNLNLNSKKSQEE